MKNNDLKKHGIIVAPQTKIVLVKYINQILNFTDKRCSIPLSVEMFSFCNGLNIEQMNKNQLVTILKKFGAYPTVLYSFKTKIDTNYYTSIKEYKTPYGPIVFLGSVADNVFYVVNYFGEVLELSNYCKYLYTYSWCESTEISYYKIREDGTILIWFIGRTPSWAIFGYNGVNLFLINAGSSMSDNLEPITSEHVKNEESLNSTIFDLTCRFPTETDLRAYLFQLTESKLNFSLDILDELNSNYFVNGVLDLSRISLAEIRFLLYRHNILPDKIFYFNSIAKLQKKTFSIKEKGLPFDKYPPIFTNIKEASFDSGGLIILEYFEKKLYKIHEPKGNSITDFCQDLDFLTESRFVSRSYNSKSGFSINKYQFSKLKVTCLKIFDDPILEYAFLPYLSRRDKVYVNYSPNKITLQDNKNLDNFNWEQSIEIKDVEESFLKKIHRHSSNFSFLSTSVQNNKVFILKALNNKCKIYNYLSDSLKVDLEILKTSLKETDLDGNVILLLPEYLLNDEELLLLSISGKQNKLNLFSKFPLKFKNDYNFIAKAISVNGLLLNYVNQDFKNNKKLVQLAIMNNSDSFEYASENLKKDKDLIQLMEKMKVETDEDLPF